MSNQTSLPKRFYTLFWDTDPHNVDIERDKWFVVEKFVNHGSLESMRWLGQALGWDAIIEVIKTNYNISTKAANLWAHVFHFDPSTCECMKRPLALRVFD
jgi:hypothetical protein